MTQDAGTVEIVVLGGFVVRVDGVVVDPQHWRRRHAAALVKLLALTPGRRLHREQVIDALWPDVPVVDAGPRLHKAAHFARRAIGRPDALVTGADTIELFPATDVRVDVIAFEVAANAALDGAGSGSGSESGSASASADVVGGALALFGGELLPDDVYEPWTVARRDHVRHLRLQLLRSAERWADVVAVEPADERAHVEIMRGHVARGDRAAALAQFDRLAQVLDEELGVAPGADAVAVRDEILAAPVRPPMSRPVESSQVIRFCHARDGVRLAYATSGGGPPLVKAANWLTHLEYDWESTIWRHWLRGLSDRFELLRYDERGCGLSDWSTTAFTMNAWVDDLEAVVDAVGIERFPLLGVSQGGAVAVEYAARHPERVSALVLYGSYVHGPLGRAEDDSARRAAALLPDLAELGWGTDDPAFRQVFTARFMPDGTRAQWDEFNELQRRSTSPTNAGRFLRAFGTIDVSAAATAVQCPTLVIHVRGDRSPPVAEGRLLASMIPGSRFISLEGDNHLMLADEPAWPRFLDELDRFLG